MTASAAHGVYVFCVARAGLVPADLADWGHGLDEGSILRGVSVGSLVAITCAVALDDFVGEDAAERLSDIGWIGPRVTRHEQVVEEALGRSPVVPARFGTIFSTTDALLAFMRGQQGPITDFLAMVGDKREWAVKGFVDRKAAVARLAAEATARQAERLATMAPGLRYMEERKIAKDAEQNLGRWTAAARDDLANRLEAVAEDANELALRTREATGMASDMILNWAFLVPADGMQAFGDAVDAAGADFAADGLTLELTGPWPPYSFCPTFASADAPGSSTS